MSEIVLKSPSKDERSEAEIIKTKILNFEFVLLCEFMHHVLNDINYASKTLQKCDIDLDETSRALAETKAKLQIYSNDFESFKCKASETSRKFGMMYDPHFQEKKAKKSWKDELASDHRFRNREEMFKITIFNNVLDTIIAQLNTLFAGMSAVSNIQFSNTNIFTRCRWSNFFTKVCDQFQSKYSNIIGPGFTLQFFNIYHLVLRELTQAWTFHELCKEIMSKYRVLECDLTEVFTAMLLFYTIPVTSAAAGRSFSKLKILKNYLRNSEGQARLRHLSLIAIEKKANIKPGFNRSHWYFCEN